MFSLLQRQPGGGPRPPVKTSKGVKHPLYDGLKQRYEDIILSDDRLYQGLFLFASRAMPEHRPSLEPAGGDN
jgi:hypothetical protein